MRLRFISLRSSLLVVIAALAFMAVSVSASLAADGQGQNNDNQGQNHGRGKSIDLGLSLVRPSADPVISAGYTDNFDIVLHNYSSKFSEKYTVAIVLVDFGDVESVFNLDSTLCVFSPEPVGPEANEYLCSGSIAPGQSISLVEAGTNNVDQVLLSGSATIRAEQHPDPITSNDTVGFEL